MKEDIASRSAAASMATRVWSYPPRRILVPVDLGEASARAVAVASALARRYQSQVTVLYADIVEAPIYFTHEQAAAIEQSRHSAAAAAESEVGRFVQAVTMDPMQIRFVDDSPPTAILEAARGADLVVMGTHGRRGPSRWWLGSVAERVVRETPVPVLVVRSDPSGASADGVFKRPLMVAGPWTFDGEAERYASGLAESFDGTLAERAASCQEDLAHERQASVLVIARPTAGQGAWFGSPAERLVRTCDLPMLFVPGRK